MLQAAGAPHQFGGALALAWYRNPRATTGIDVNLTLPPEAAEPVLELLLRLGVTVGPGDRAAMTSTGRPGSTGTAPTSTCSSPPPTCTSKWPQTPARSASGPVDIPILAPEDLIVCKAVFDRPKDWLDIEEMLRWGTAVDAARTLHWVGARLGPESERYTRLSGLLSAGPADPIGRVN